jgi:large subunit ribosomal protein L9
MEVILREHIDTLGRRGDVVKVAAGYARNYLLPQKLALAVTENNRKQIVREQKVAEVKDAEERNAGAGEGASRRHRAAAREGRRRAALALPASNG